MKRLEIDATVDGTGAGTRVAFDHDQAEPFERGARRTEDLQVLRVIGTRVAGEDLVDQRGVAGGPLCYSSSTNGEKRHEDELRVQTCR